MNLFIKRIVDISASLILIIFFSPIIICISLIIKASSKGPIIYCQKRAGKNMIPFTIFKFRTMIDGAETKKRDVEHFNEADGPVFKIYNDPRFTKLGKLLSHSGLDEIPQLLNVIRGNMSLVGPRPLPVAEANKVPKKYHKRFSVLPGMTSTWIISGSHQLSFNQWMELDVNYVKRSTLLMDAQILFVTFIMMGRWIFPYNKRKLKYLINYFRSVDLKKLSTVLIQVIISTLLFIGGLGVIKAIYINIFGAVLGFVFLLIMLLRGRNMKFPPNFGIFSVFIILLTVSLVWSRIFTESLKFGLLFIAGWSYWLISYNVRDDYSHWINNMLIFLGLGFGTLFILSSYYHWPIFSGLSLFLTPSAIGKFHFHIGDYWAVIGIIIIYQLVKDPKKLHYWLLIPPTIYFIYMSMSRAAIVSIAVGFIFLNIKGFLTSDKFKKKLVIFMLVVFFIVTSISKDTILSRPYFIQALAGIKYYPWGVGLGNFSIISHDVRTHLLGLSQFSLYTHNIILEMFSAIGILGTVFLVWFIQAIRNLFSDNNKGNMLFQAIFVVISVNFLFDYTYFIPTMCWLWFICLGQAQKDLPISS